MTTAEFIEDMRVIYPHIEETDMARIVEKAKMFYYGLRYPFNSGLIEEDSPITTFFATTWVKAACEEIIERLGFSSATAYSENSVHWSFDNCQLSNRLCNMVVPLAGTV